MRRSGTMAVSVLACQVLLAAEERSPAAGARNYVAGPGRVVTQRALDGAVERLHSPACRRLFSEFSARDIPLSGKLQDLGLTPEEYVIKWMWFLDGSADRRCRLKDVAAYTQPGSRIVYVCPARLSNERGDGAFVIIHEMLHSLGLGENPPTTKEITKQVLERCGG